MQNLPAFFPALKNIHIFYRNVLDEKKRTEQSGGLTYMGLSKQLLHNELIVNVPASLDSFLVRLQVLELPYLQATQCNHTALIVSLCST